MGNEPLKKELETIDAELEAAMVHLTETSKRVDDVLADFNEDGEAKRPAPVVQLRPDAADSEDIAADEETADEEE